jgi:hypothetical protein
MKKFPFSGPLAGWRGKPDLSGLAELDATVEIERFLL